MYNSFVCFIESQCICMSIIFLNTQFMFELWHRSCKDILTNKEGCNTLEVWRPQVFVKVSLITMSCHIIGYPIHYRYESSYHKINRCNRVPYINHALSWAKGKFTQDTNLKMSHAVIVHQSYYKIVVQLVWENMDVYEHERLSYLIHKHNLRHTFIVAMYFTDTVGVFISKHNSCP